MIKTVSQLLDGFIKAENQALKKQNVSHRPTIGDMYEGLTKELLNKALPTSSDLNVTAGFIVDKNGEKSAELDCLLVDGKGEQIPYTDKFKYSIDDVVAVIQVKKNLYSTDIEEGYQNLNSFMKFEVSKPRRAVLLRDAFQTITRRPLPKSEDVDKLPIEIQMIYHGLVRELHVPARILLGYNGFKSLGNFRDSFVEYLSNQFKNGTTKGYGPISFPNLIICGDYSLVKCNGMPFIAPLEKDYYWPFYCSSAKAPIEILLQIIWTRLVYQEQMASSVFDDDVWLSSFARLLSARFVSKGAQQGWEYQVTSATDLELQQPTDEKLWEPVFLDLPQFVVVTRLCKEENIDLTEPKLVLFLKEHGWDLDAMVKSLNTKGLAARDGNQLVLLTRGCSCVILPDGRYVAGENIANQLSKWVAIYIAKRNNKKTLDSLTFENDFFPIPDDKPLIIGDDEQAKKVISILGLTEPLEKAKQERADKNLILLVSEHHATHWIAVGHFNGFSQPIDNGYFVVCHPKKSESLEDFKLSIQSLFAIPETPQGI